MNQSGEPDGGREAFHQAALDRSYKPGRSGMERDVSVDVSPERPAQAALRGGAPRRED